MPFETIALGFGFLAAAAAQAEAPAPSDRTPTEVQAVLACQAEQSEQRRLACYDAAADKLASATRTGAIVVLDKEELRKTRRSFFGFSLPSVSLFRGDAPGDEPNQLEAKVQSAQVADYGHWRVVLDNGAVWQTTEVERRLPLPKPGQSVTIRKAALGSYMLSVNGRRGIRAMRVR
ncbi:MAG TPA: hypothetical protein VGB59_05265 [Allosphingosinicella sp.]|jgi:hypothetical protein